MTTPGGGDSRCRAVAGHDGRSPGAPAFRAARRVGRAALLLALLLPLGCGGDGASPDAEQGTITREAFIDAYIALRVVGLRAPQQLIAEEDRRRILSERGVTEEDLLTFVEVHGRDLESMQGIWNDVEARLEALRTQSDSSEGRS